MTLRDRRTGDRPPIRVRAGVAVAALLVAVVVASCKADTSLTVTVKADGSGTVRARVTFDADAAKQVPPATIRLDDLSRAGWRVTHDATSITVQKPFADAGALPRVLRELTGPDGVVRVASLTRDESFLHVRYALHLDVDLRALGARVADDAALAQRLRAAGVDPAALDARLSGALRDAVSTNVRALLPGGGVRTWHVAPGGHVDARATSTVSNGGRLWWLVASGVLVVLALLVVVLSVARRRRSRVRGRVEPRGEVLE
jgi:hypothetical protein